MQRQIHKPGSIKVHFSYGEQKHVRGFVMFKCSDQISSSLTAESYRSKFTSINLPNSQIQYQDIRTVGVSIIM